MKAKFLLFSFFSFFILCGCEKTNIDTKKFQEIILEQEKKGDEFISSIKQTLNNVPDSLTSIILKQEQEDILLYIFKEKELVFWKENWLAMKPIEVSKNDTWFYFLFQNAHSICKLIQVNNYYLLTVIPIKNNYPFENEELVNDFLVPFNLNKTIEIIQDSTCENHIYNSHNEYLFSLCISPEYDLVEGIQTRIADSFSYTQILSSGNDKESIKNKYISQNKIRIYFIIMISLMVICIGICLYSVYKYKGFRNLKLSYKFEFLFVMLLLVSFVYIFLMSVDYVEKRYESRQQKDLQSKTTYIQKALQEIYYWNTTLHLGNNNSLSTELKDLSLTYQTDIHVYDSKGKLVGSSLPILFEKGILSKRMSPYPFFSENPTLTQYEKIGNVEYLSAYTTFYNGDFLPIGYIAVPLFISSEELAAEINDLLSKLIPMYLAVIMLSIIITFILGKQLTAPIRMIESKMMALKVDGKNEKIEYKPQDEIGQLVEQYNLMVDKLEQSAHLLAKSERENAWKTMARQIAHEINNPLTPMKLTIQQLQRTKTLDDETFDNYFKKSTTLLIEQIDNLSRIAGMFSNFAKLPEIRLQKVDIAQRIHSVCVLFESENVSRINYIGNKDNVFAIADKEQITQVFNNLIKNALQATSAKVDGEITIVLTENSDTIVISIADNGSGISADIQDKVFMPNFTTKSTGMGLGLAISKNIIESSNGSIGFETSKQGTTFTVILPRA